MRKLIVLLTLFALMLIPVLAQAQFPVATLSAPIQNVIPGTGIGTASSGHCTSSFPYSCRHYLNVTIDYISYGTTGTTVGTFAPNRDHWVADWPISYGTNMYFGDNMVVIYGVMNSFANADLVTHLPGTTYIVRSYSLRFHWEVINSESQGIVVDNYSTEYTNIP